MNHDAKLSDIVGEEALDAAMTLLRRWYYSRIRSIAEDLKDRIYGEREPPEWGADDEWDRDGFLDSLWDEVDATDLVIYTFKAKACLFASDNEDADLEEMGEKAKTSEAQAFYAIRADVLEVLDVLIRDAGGSGIDAPFPESDDESEDA